MSMIFSENRFPPRIKSGAGFFGITRCARRKRVTLFVWLSDDRRLEIVGLDLQPCGGTHVRRTAEIGAVRVTTIEKKGKQNRRVRISFA